MQRDPVYPSAPRTSTFADGIEFQDFVCVLMAERHIILQNLASKKYQYEVGENLQGFEIKLDTRCTETGRLSIEIAEKSNAANDAWVPSGIYRGDNSFVYVQGNYDKVWIFGKNQLQRYHKQKKPTEHESYGTVRKFYIPIAEADVLAIRVLVPDPKKRKP